MFISSNCWQNPGPLQLAEVGQCVCHMLCPAATLDGRYQNCADGKSQTWVCLQCLPGSPEPLSVLAACAQPGTNRGTLSKGHLWPRNQHKRVVALSQRCQSPPAAQINFPLPVDAGRSWQPVLSQACQTQISLKDECSQEARDFYPTSRLIISYYFSRASTVLLKTRGLFCKLLNGLF